MMKRNLIVLLCFLSLACQTRRAEFYAKSLPKLEVPAGDSYTQVARDLKDTLEIQAGLQGQPAPILPETQALADDIKNNSDAAIVAALPDKPSDPPTDNPQKPKTPTNGKMWYFLGPAIVTTVMTAAIAAYAAASYKRYKVQQAYAKTALASEKSAKADANSAQESADSHNTDAQIAEDLIKAKEAEADAIKNAATKAKTASDAEIQGAKVAVEQATARRQQAEAALTEARQKKAASDAKVGTALNASREISTLQLKTSAAYENIRLDMMALDNIYEEIGALDKQIADANQHLQGRTPVVGAVADWWAGRDPNVEIARMKTAREKLVASQLDITKSIAATNADIEALQQRIDDIRASVGTTAQQQQAMADLVKDFKAVNDSSREVKAAAADYEKKNAAAKQLIEEAAQKAKAFDASQQKLRAQVDEVQAHKNLSTVQAMEAEDLARNKSMEADAYNKQAKKFQAAGDVELSKAKYATGGAVAGLVISAALGALAGASSKMGLAAGTTGPQDNKIDPKVKDVLNMLEYRVILLKGAQAAAAAK